MKLSPKVLGFTTSKIAHVDLSKVSNEELWGLYQQYLNIYDEVYTWGEPITLGLKENLGRFLYDYLLKQVNNKKKATDYLNLLVSPPEQSFVQREQKDLLKIALAIEQNKSVVELFKQDIKKLNLELKKPAYQEIYSLIKKHTDDYCWVPYDYGIVHWDEQYFIKSLQALLHEGNTQSKLNEMALYYNELPKKQHAIIMELAIDQYHQDLFQVLRDASFLMDYKKEIFTKSHYHIRLLLDEIGKRLGISRNYVQLYMPEELQDALVHKKILSKSVLSDREKCSILFSDKDKMFLYQGKEAYDLLKKYNIADNEEAKVSSFEGMIASGGKAIGIVKVVFNAKEIEKVQKGDILVAPMTSPDYVPAMRKAGAIITDEGGITCHAAIVSRELGIPCIIGTKIATKLLKDGQQVEVNANHGVIKLIE
ncbi:hypothetical protein HYY69_03950 [Candidatus Woesearchaeota archaeon]|nr:hypothetical protein [Candidatus Woesearchaeota archaeon]